MVQWLRQSFHCRRHSGELRSHKPHGAGQKKKVLLPEKKERVNVGYW